MRRRHAFWNNQVLSETDAVLEMMLRALQEGVPHPNLPPLVGEGTGSAMLASFPVALLWLEGAT